MPATASSARTICTRSSPSSPRVYGRVRIPGQLIWATRFKEEKRKVKQANAGGGKNVGITADQSGAVEYRYYANVAYALCEGPILGVTQIWADGKKLKQKKVNFTVHLGSEDQEPDPFIESKEGAGKVPAYRGVAYVVFKEWPLEAFGNRLPVVNFEVIRAFDPFEEQVRAVTVIPGAGEFIYDPEPVIATTGGVTVPENVHQEDAATDALASAIQLAHLLPNVRRLSLVVTWFGTDLRIGHCQIRPGVETAVKTTEPYAWRAGGVDRASAHVVSQIDGRPAYGGTPSDISVARLLQAANDLGIDVTVYPFIAMDVPAGNALPNPYTGESGQPDYPWRGRITCDPAPGQPGSVDKRTGLLTARSYLAWGKKLAAPKQGCIVVFTRGNSAWQGHVAFFDHWERDKLVCLGGNQSDRVCFAAYLKSRVIGYRWPL